MALTALDGLNFFLADVRGGLGPYVNVLLVTDAHWSPFAVGSTLMVSGLIGITALPAVGAFIDRTHRKREAIIVGAFLLSACALAIATWPILPVVLVAEVTMALLGGLFAPSDRGRPQASSAQRRRHPRRPSCCRACATRMCPIPTRSR
jgi:predicted MFS family arabinose efflux permease